MWHLSEAEYEARMKKIKDNNVSRERRRKLIEEKRKYKSNFKLPSTSKLVLLVVFLLCIEILIFSEYAMIALGDVSAMYVLIGIPATLVPTVLAYYSKSKAENTAYGIVYEKTMHELNQYNEEEYSSEDEPVG